MDETTDSIIERITIHSDKPMRLGNGEYSTTFYDCIQLSPNELARLAALAVGALPENQFDLAVGIAYSGILFAAAVAGGKQVAILDHEYKIQGPDIHGKRIILVDDVIHHGSRIKLALDAVSHLGALIVGVACIIQRQSDKSHSLKVPLWSACQVSIR